VLFYRLGVQKNANRGVDKQDSLVDYHLSVENCLLLLTSPLVKTTFIITGVETPELDFNPFKKHKPHQS
jgi:hypothetical protein